MHVPSDNQRCKRREQARSAERRPAEMHRAERLKLGLRGVGIAGTENAGRVRVRPRADGMVD